VRCAAKIAIIWALKLLSSALSRSVATCRSTLGIPPHYGRNACAKPPGSVPRPAGCPVPRSTVLESPALP